MIANLPARYTTSTFTPGRASAFVCRLSGGRSLAAVCRDADMPSRVTVQNWMKKDPQFAAQVAAVRDLSGGRRSPGGHTPPRYSEELARRICDGLADGLTLKQVCADPAIPVGPQCVRAWVRKRPAFAACYRLATAPRMTPQGLRIGRGRRGGYTLARAEAVIERLLDEGRPLADIARDPDMPAASVVRHWRRRHWAFYQDLHAARCFQLHLAFDALLAAVDSGRRTGPLRPMISALLANGYTPLTAPPTDYPAGLVPCLPEPKPARFYDRRRSTKVSATPRHRPSWRSIISAGRSTPPTRGPAAPHRGGRRSRPSLT